MNNSQKPVARQDGLVIQEMPDEILVFDLESNKAHCLNQTAAFVWKSCDGKNSVTEIARLFGDESGKPVQEDLIWLAIDQLNDNNLLAESLKADFKNQTRRDVIKKIGLAAVIALPPGFIFDRTDRRARRCLQWISRQHLRRRGML